MQSEEHVIYMVVGRQGPGRPKILYTPSTIFQLNREGSSWVEQVLS